MALKLNRINKFECVKCRTELDSSQHMPFTKIVCPNCGRSSKVPALFGKHVLLEKVGEGTSGTVFRSVDRELHRQVAIKILNGPPDDNVEDNQWQDLMESSLREARMLASINHDNVVKVFTLSSHNEQPYIEMEMLDGGTVAELLDVDRLPSEADVLDLGLHVTMGLEAALKAGLVHMDVKPGNILYDGQGRPKLIDFGAAQKDDEATFSGFFGTPYYVAPEAAKRQHDGNQADFRADMYSLGATMFHLLTGHPPFKAETAKDTVLLRFKERAPRVDEYRDDLSPETVDLIARLLEPHAHNRFENYDDLIVAIEAALDSLHLEGEDHSEHMHMLVAEAHQHHLDEEDAAVDDLAAAFENETDSSQQNLLVAEAGQKTPRQTPQIKQELNGDVSGREVISGGRYQAPANSATIRASSTQVAERAAQIRRTQEEKKGTPILLFALVGAGILTAAIVLTIVLSSPGSNLDDPFMADSPAVTDPAAVSDPTANASSTSGEQMPQEITQAPDTPPDTAGQDVDPDAELLVGSPIKIQNKPLSKFRVPAGMKKATEWAFPSGTYTGPFIGDAFLVAGESPAEFKWSFSVASDRQFYVKMAYRAENPKKVFATLKLNGEQVSRQPLQLHNEFKHPWKQSYFNDFPVRAGNHTLSLAFTQGDPVLLNAISIIDQGPIAGELVGHWTFDKQNEDGGIPNVAKNGIAALTLKGQGMEFGDQAYLGKAPLFPNKGQYQMPEIAEAWPGITVAMWLRLKSVNMSGYNNLFHSKLPWEEGRFAFYIEKGKLSTEVKGWEKLVHDKLNFKQKVDTWTHVAVTQNVSNGDQRLYVNGGLVKQAMTKTPMNSVRPGEFLIGAFSTSGKSQRNLHAVIDEVRLYNGVLYSNAIYKLFHNTKKKRNQLEKEKGD